MDEFEIKNVRAEGSLVFFDRSPADRDKPIENFWIRVSENNLSAAVQVYAAVSPSPVDVFEAMAQMWQGWQGELCWDSLEGEASLHCGRDKFGHILIRTRLRPSLYPGSWRVEATTVTEAGQLELIARRAKEFFGRGP
jgi:hypothetical protein